MYMQEESQKDVSVQEIQESTISAEEVQSKDLNIDTIPVKDVKNIALEVLLKGEKGEDGAPEPYMQYIDLSEDFMNPTALEDYIDKSGLYVAKNMGVLGRNGQPLTIIPEGQFFEVTNMKDLATLMGQEIPDEENHIIVTLPSLENNKWVLKKQGLNNWEQATLIDSLNYSDYININTSQFLKKSQINNAYGIRLYNNYLATFPATQAEINTGTNQYKPITPNTIAYAIQTKGRLYFADNTEFQELKTEVETLKSDTETLISEIETILDSVVNVNE